jgi:FkbM family methyltransferase
MSTADVITLDAYVQERQLGRVDLIKVDVEGAELSVLQGASRVLKRDRPA